MRVRIVHAVFDNSAFFDALDRLLDHFLSGRHYWQIDDVDEIRRRVWLSINDRVTRRNTEILEKCFVAGAQTPPSLMHRRTLDIGTTSAPPSTLGPSEAHAYLSAPAIVIVENEESDGAFLHATLRAYDRVHLWFSFENHWIELDHAGGYGEVEKRIERYVGRTQGPPRVLVLADSDRLHRDHLSQTEAHIREVCARHAVPCAILRKRAIENYLPVGALQRSPRRDCYQGFLQLNAEQRDYYNMKKGFSCSNSGDSEVPAEQARLFQHLPSRALKNLIGGFGKEVWRLFKDAQDVITGDTMRLTCQADPQELPDLFDQIEGLI